MKDYDFSNNSTNTYKVEPRHALIPTCPECGEFSTVLFDGTDYFQYFVQGNGQVQTVFHYLSPEQRDLIITGIHPECSDDFYGVKELGSNIAEGGSFMFKGVEHTILGFSTGDGFVHYMYSTFTDAENLTWPCMWRPIEDTYKWVYEEISELTVLDLISAAFKEAK